MQWTDTAIILSVRLHGERSALVRALCRQHGICAGLATVARKPPITFAIGNVVQLTWQARLSEQLGRFRGELLESTSAMALDDAAALYALTCACTLVERLLPERVEEPRVWEQLQRLCTLIRTRAPWWGEYARLELLLLRECGFRLDFRACAATGVRENLVYLSPKTGRAVSRQAGAPYHEKMLPLPAFFLQHEIAPQRKEMLEALRTTGYFLAHFVLAPHGRNLPKARTQLIDQLEKHSEKCHLPRQPAMSPSAM